MEFQDVESACSGRLSHVQPAVVPSPRGRLSRDQSLRSDTWNLLGTSGNVFENPPAPVDAAWRPCRGILHPWFPNATYDDPMQLSTGRPVVRGEEQNGDTIATPRFARKPSTRNSLYPAEGSYPQNYTVDQQKTSDLGTSI